MKEQFKVGQPVICHEDDDSNPIFGLVTKVYEHEYYEVEWCDGQYDMYPQHNISLFVNAYNKIKEKSR